MYCKICGAPLTPGDVFCKNCGASNNNNASEPKAPEVEPVVNEMPQNPVDNAPAEKIIEENVSPENNEQVEVMAPTVEPVMNEPVENIEQTPNVEPVPDAEPVPNVEPVENTEQVPNAEPVMEEPVQNVPEEAGEQATPKQAEGKEDKSGKFLLVIGIVVGILAILVIAYLIYSSLGKNTPTNGGGQVTIITQNTYTIRYGDYNFVLSSTDLVEVGEVLHVENANYIARINYVDAPSFSSLTADNIKNAFENITEYKVENIVSKTYSGVSCFEGNITYTNNAKTALLLCNREEGYWSIEVGTRGFSAFPTSDVNNSVVKIIAEAKKVTVEDSPLKVGKVQVEVPTESPTETENQ